MRIDVLNKSLVAKNDKAAAENRALFQQRGIAVVNIMGGAGSGKTTLLECTIPQLARDTRVAVLEGDLATTRDAERIAALNVPVVQLLTEGGCHLTAALVQQGVQRLPTSELDLILIENVGNPICPVNFDLGERARLAVLSVAEGDDKPAKYPYLFTVADLVVISKHDLLDVSGFDFDAAAADIHALDSGKRIISTSSRDAASTQPVADWFRSLCQRCSDTLPPHQAGM